MERSSDSPRVIIYHAAQCDPKKCTGLRLGRRKRAVIVKDQRRIPRGAVILNPVSEIAFSPADHVYVDRSGLVALDCSWKQAEAVFK
ncbi:MAG: ribosome biogenesis protein, partial [Promethearchaeota archaeon]